MGKSLIEFLLGETDYKIISMVRDAPSSAASSDGRVRVVSHDLKEPIGKKCAAEIGEINYIIHFAALTNIQESVVNPMDYILNNVHGTLNLLEFARTQVKYLQQFLYFSSAEIFGRHSSSTVLKETDPPLSYSPYAATKIGAQELCLSYKNTFGIPIVIAYAMNTFGLHQAPEKFIPSIIKKILKDERVLIHSDRTGIPHRRNYLSVGDLCDAILFLSRHGVSGEKYNIAANEESNNLKLAQTISRLLGKTLVYELVESEQNSAVLPRLGAEKLYNLGWHQKKTLEQGLKELITEYTSKGRSDDH